MSTDTFEGGPSSFPAGLEYRNAIDNMLLGESLFLRSTTRWTKVPTPRHLNNIDVAGELASRAFRYTLNVLFAHDEMDVDDQLWHVANLFKQTDSARVVHFKRLAPAGDFQEYLGTHEQLATMLGQSMVQGATPKDMSAATINQHDARMAADKAMLLDTVVLSPKAKAIKNFDLLSEQAGNNLLQISRIAAGSAIGILIAERLSGQLHD
jgi:hypothetical protein